MVMGVPAPQFPFDQYYQAQAASRPKAIAGQALGNLGNIIPQLIQYFNMQKSLDKMGQPGSLQQPTSQSPMAGVDGMTRAPLPPPPQADSSLQTLIPLLKSSMMPGDTSVMQNVLPALTKGMTHQKGASGMNPYQEKMSGLAERRIKDNEEYLGVRKHYMDLIDFYKKKGDKRQEAALRAHLADLDSKQGLISRMMMPSPSEAAGIDLNSGSGSDDGWKVEPAE